MNFENVTYERGMKLLDEISKEKKLLTFKKIFKIIELNALLSANR